MAPCRLVRVTCAPETGRPRASTTLPFMLSRLIEEGAAKAPLATKMAINKIATAMIRREENRPAIFDLAFLPSLGQGPEAPYGNFSCRHRSRRWLVWLDNSGLHIKSTASAGIGII